jgi:hypothetical protein
MLLGPLAEKLVLAHPKKQRVIAESRRKSGRLDAQVLAEFLALDMILQAFWGERSPHGRSPTDSACPGQGRSASSERHALYG